MYSIDFVYHLNANEKYNIIASCKNINDYDVTGLSFKFVDDEGSTIRVKYDPDLFEDIEQEATRELLEEYYNRVSSGMH